MMYLSHMNNHLGFWFCSWLAVLGDFLILQTRCGQQAVANGMGKTAIHVCSPPGAPSHCPTLPSLLDCRRAPGWVSCVTRQRPTSCLFTCGNAYAAVLLSQFIPRLLPSAPPCSWVCSLFPPCKVVQQYHFSGFHIYVLICYLFLSFLLSSLYRTDSRFIYIFTCDPILFHFMAEYYSIVWKESCDTYQSMKYKNF